MSFLRYLLLFLIIVFGLTSCLVTEQVKTIQVEVMKPSTFIFPESVNRLAIIKRSLFKSDTSLIRYKSLIKYNQYENIIDSTINPSDLSNRCVDALSDFFKNDGYFKEVKNYRDSLNYFWTNDSCIYSPEELFAKANADLIIFLDFFKFYNIISSNSFNYLNTSAGLSWAIACKNDTALYIYNQIDTLEYDDFQFENFNLERDGPEKILFGAAEYLGKSFGTKIIPSWIPVERMYYESKNPDMLKAEKFALNDEWLKAAEKWNPETKNKNQRIVAKACYNMALAAEMEGKHNLAIDWLVKSYSALPKNNMHKLNCQRYINVLALRMKEIEQLKKQVRKPKNVLNQAMHQ